jgi:hypothetical protein
VKSSPGFSLKVCLFCCVVLLLSSCADQQGGAGRDPDKDVKKLTCLIVLPTETPIDTDRKMSFAEANTLQKGALFIDGVIAEELKNFKGARLLNASQVEGLSAKISGNRIEMIKGIGRELKCDMILITMINRFHQRGGGEYATDNPASAAFALELVRVDDGQVMWRGTFDETQESLLSNLLSFGKAQSRGFKWVSVEELVRQGVHERLSTCPYLE